MNDRLPLSERPPLTTKRLLLRRPNQGDAGAIVDSVGDWEVARHLSRVPYPYRLTDAEFFLEHVAAKEWVWAITVHGAQRLVGAVGLTLKEGADEAALGYWLSRAYWGRGIVTDAANAVVSFGFDTLRLGGITASYFEENPASGRVLEKLGFVTTGRVMLSSLAVGTDMPSVQMHLSPSLQACPGSVLGKRRWD